ncbi:MULTISPECIES: galactokinase [Antarcticibacterium]|uniref:galactokinase n=1 Tax=Antarcticibacterium sp. W02-3 TaxID=2183747 RepID=UPI001FE60327|nr:MULTISPECIES: galactokinase [Antarcticibacterium]
MKNNANHISRPLLKPLSFNSQVNVAAPGRINLIGEHTDYNHGYVLPTAIDRKINFSFQRNNSQSICNVYSKTVQKGFSFDLKDIEKSNEIWENYILGVVNEILKRKKDLQGFDCIIESKLPIGAGISSSAALECGLAAGLNELFNLKLTKKEIVFLSQAAENNFVGSNCGIMDQFASVMSRKDHLILLDCLNLEPEFIPANFNSCKMVLVNTMVSHSLAEGEYNTRRKECEAALKVLQSHYTGIETLRDVNLEMLTESSEHLTGAQFHRVKYVLEENKRVLDAAKFLKAGQLEDFGALMYKSHYGLRDLYEVSCKELDFLVEFTENISYIYGSRMMGGGFGGCTINIVEESQIPSFENEVKQAYAEAFGLDPDVIIVSPGEGTVVERV